MFSTDIAIELLALCASAQFQSKATLEASNPLLTTTGTDATLRGEPVRGARAMAARSWKADTELFVAHSDGGDIVVAFRGSETPHFGVTNGAWRDWALTDLRANRTPYPPAPGGWPDRRWVHAGFWDAYSPVMQPLIADVQRQRDRTSTPGDIFVTGFSLGGALALLAAIDLGKAFPGRVRLYTFAAPRVGDGSLNKLMLEVVNQSYVVILHGDPVPHTPPLGPNIPITVNPFNVLIGGVDVPLQVMPPTMQSGPFAMQVGQHYQTADTIVYMTDDGTVKDHLPIGEIAVNFARHDFGTYDDALQNIPPPASGQIAPPARSTDIVPFIHPLLLSV